LSEIDPAVEVWEPVDPFESRNKKEPGTCNGDNIMMFVQMYIQFEIKS
jgi:hypothetical protein